MSPRTIINRAKIQEIDIIGICDHNSTENSSAAMDVGKKLNVCVLPGIEVTSREEVHILALFDTIKDALRLQKYIYDNLPGENDEDTFGMQVIVNEKDEVLGFNNKLLIGATTIPIEEVIQIIHLSNGMAIASHIDREAFSIIGQLGFVPENLELDALEISPLITKEEAEKKFNINYPITCFSDAHLPDDIGKSYTTFLLNEGTVAEIKKALHNKEGRKLIH
jgi:hypothetical protein